MAGTVAFAASGAMVGVERNMDIFGVSVLGVVTAVGGGMIRDIVLGLFHLMCLQIRYMPWWLPLLPVWFFWFFTGNGSFWKGICGLPMTESCW